MKITEKLQHTFALSHEGAVDMVKACVSVTVTNMSFMMSAGVLYTLIKDMLGNNLTKERIPFYVIASIAIIVLIALTNYIQYGATFLSTYMKTVGSLLHSLAERGKTVIVSTHDPELISLCCQYLLCIENGRVKYFREV